MAKRKKASDNPTAADLPTNPEFQTFVAFTGALMRVPKADVAAIIAEERETFAKNEHPTVEVTESFVAE